MVKNEKIVIVKYDAHAFSARFPFPFLNGMLLHVSLTNGSQRMRACALLCVRAIMFAHRYKSSDEKPNHTAINFMCTRERAKLLRSIITDIGEARGAVYNSIFCPPSSPVTPPVPVTFSCAAGGRPVFNGNGRGYRGRRGDRREIKLETSNISPLGAVAILRAISIRDVVIENERALSSLCLWRILDAGENFISFFSLSPSLFGLFFSPLLQRTVPPESRMRARACWKLKRRLSNFLPAPPRLRTVSPMDWHDRPFDWSVYEKFPTIGKPLVKLARQDIALFAPYVPALCNRGCQIKSNARRWKTKCISQWIMP